MTIELSGDGLSVQAVKRIKGRTSILSPSDDSPGLGIHGCDLLSDDADWDADTWDMSADGKAALRKALTVVMEEVGGAFCLTALWYEGPDTPPVPMEAVSRSELLELVASGSVSSRFGYRVAPLA